MLRAPPAISYSDRADVASASAASRRIREVAITLGNYLLNYQRLLLIDYYLTNTYVHMSSAE